MQHPIPTPRRYSVLLAFIVLVGFVLRLHFLASGGIVIDSDEAIVGLMARHMLAGRPIPIFYYGQHYMGSLEPLLVAGSFAILGKSSFALKLVPLLFSLSLICLIYELAKRFVGAPRALVAAGLAAIPPSPLLIWSVMARGGFIELLALGTLALILTVDIIQLQTFTIKRFGLLGFLLGLGWWVNNQIIFYLAPIGLVLGVYTLRRIPIWPALSLGMIGLGSFFIGGLPFWYYNLLERPRLRSFGLFSPADTAKIPDYIQGFFSEALPMMFGARRFWSEADIFPFASHVALALGAFCVVYLSLLWARRNFCADLGLLLAFVVFLPVIFCLSSFGFLSLAPRYLLPMYSVLFVTMVIFPGDGTALAGFLRLFQRGLWTAFFTINLISNYGFGGAVPGQPFVYMGDRVPIDNSELYRWLHKEGYHFIRANYWIGYRVAFESGESIKFSHFRGQGVRRIADYERANPGDESEVAYVLSPREGGAIARAFSLLGYTFRTTSLPGYQIIDQVSRGNDRVMDARAVRITASVNPAGVSALTDGEIGTRWGSGTPQNPSMSLNFDFAEQTVLSGLDINYGFWGSDYPRDLLILGVSPDGSSCPLLDTRGESGLKYYLEGEAILQLRFPPQAFRSISLLQSGNDPVFDWSVAEVTFKKPGLPED